MTAPPTISIITPAYNASEFLSQTVASALAQTFRDFELLIVDDGSTDDTRNIALTWARTDPRIRILTRPHGGPSAARNTAIADARGQYFALLDSDDLWHPTFLDAQMSILTSSRTVDIVTGNAYNLGGARDGEPINPISKSCPQLSLRELRGPNNSGSYFPRCHGIVRDQVGSLECPAAFTSSRSSDAAPGPQIASHMKAAK